MSCSYIDLPIDILDQPAYRGSPLDHPDADPCPCCRERGMFGGIALFDGEHRGYEECWLCGFFRTDDWSQVRTPSRRAIKRGKVRAGLLRRRERMSARAKLAAPVHTFAATTWAEVPPSLEEFASFCELMNAVPRVPVLTEFLVHSIREAEPLLQSLPARDPPGPLYPFGYEGVPIRPAPLAVPSGEMWAMMSDGTHETVKLPARMELKVVSRETAFRAVSPLDAFRIKPV